jgi:hypothetical protein
MSKSNKLEKIAGRVSARAWGVALGAVLGIGLFVVTNVLVLRGGEDVGQHLGRIAYVLPGYRVTFFGSLLGLVYGFVIGYSIGRLVGPRAQLARPVATDAGAAVGASRLGLHARLAPGAWSRALGLSAAGLLAVATLVLVARGGEHPGQFLSHLHIYFPGYSVTVTGAIIGFAYAFVLFALMGRAIAVLYGLGVRRAER